MTSTLAQARRFQDLLASTVRDTPYLFDRIFSDSGFSARRLSKKKFQMLKKIDAAVRPMLEEGEQVYSISWGIRTSAVESYFLGWAIYFLNRMAFVLTTERILLLQVGPRNRPRALRSQIRYPAITKVKRGLLGSVTLKFRNGKKVVFQGIPRRDSKALRDLIERLVQRGADVVSRSDAMGLEHLCPSCYAPVNGFPERCSACGTAFKSRRKAGLLSLLFPGLGDFYLGHRKLALLEMGGAGLIWAAYLMPTESGPGPDLTVLLIGAALIFLFVHGIDAAVTRYLAGRGIYPDG